MAELAAGAVSVEQQQQHIDFTVRMMERQGNDIFPRITDVRRDNFALISNELIDPAQTRRFTEAERGTYDTGAGVMVQLPEGYLHIDGYIV